LTLLLTTANSPLIDCHQWVVGYSAPIVGPIDLQVSPGEVVALTGANGCGKSTLLRAICGTARHWGGAYRRRSDLTIAHQSQSIDDGGEMPLSGYDLATAAGIDLRQPLAEIAPLLRPRLDRLSGGQRQLLQVWIALAGSANLILLDEPTNNLAPPITARVVDLLKRCDRWRGVVVVSHDLPFIAQVATRTLHLPSR
jgi:ATPase subunit of ABC transporter with duplicated ATPase domains